MIIIDKTAVDVLNIMW